MVFSKRERYIAIGAGSVIALLLINTLVVSPYSARRDQISKELDDTNDSIRKDNTLFAEQKKLRLVWNEMNANGLTTNRAIAEGQVQYALDDWAQACGMDVSSLAPDHEVTDAHFVQISFHLNGTGPQSTMANLLWQVESSKMPLRITELQLTPRKEGVDDVQLHLTVSTLCQLPDAEKPAKPGRPAGATADAR